MLTAQALIVLALIALISPAALAGENIGALGFAWPVTGPVVDEEDGRKSRASTEGIDILVPEGTKVRASLAGTVIYAGNDLKSFGNLILIRHAEGWVTVYGHNSEIFVNRGEEVQAGDVIARSGRTGFVARPELRFEIRKRLEPWNPAQYLPLLKAQEPEIP